METNTLSASLYKSPCPCNSGQTYDACCGIYHRDIAAATTAEALMRSRYTAYSRLDEAYILRTWHPSTRPPSVILKVAPAPKWLGLEILGVEAGSTDDRSGTVEFIARYKLNGKASRLHEKSRFVKDNGHWYYVDGEVN